MEQRYEQDEVEIDLREIFFALLSKIWILIGTTVAGAVAAVLITILCITPMYSSTASLYIISKSTTLTSLTDIQLGSQLTQDYMVIARSRKVISQVIEELELNETYEQFLGRVSIYNENNTRVLSLTIQDADPYMAKTIVDKYADVTARETAEIMETSLPHDIDKGVVADSPVSPSLKRNILIGAFLGFLLSAGIIIIMHLLNDAVQGAEDAEKYLGLTNLGSIPVYESAHKGGKRSLKRRDRSSSDRKKEKKAS